MAHVIINTCTKDALCVSECPVDAIAEGDNQYFINPDDCIDCGACTSVCPSESIYPEDEVPEANKAAIEENAKHFQ